MVKCTFKKWTDIDRMARKLFEKIQESKFQPDIIVGISRGGWIPARLLSDILESSITIKGSERKTILANMQITFYTRIAETHARPVISQDLNVDIRGKKILLVDDLVDSGESIQCALDYLKLKDSGIVKVATLLYKPTSKIIPDYYIETTEDWIVFPHEVYEFMTERSQSQNFNEIEAWKEFLELGIPESSINFFLDRFIAKKE